MRRAWARAAATPDSCIPKPWTSRAELISACWGALMRSCHRELPSSLVGWLIGVAWQLRWGGGL
jgi:hypothetical protein